MISNDVKQLHQSVLLNEKMITNVDEAFQSYMNTMSADSNESAEHDLKELIDIVFKYSE